jgi:hypothetical protein
MKKVRAKFPEKPLNELMRFLFCRPVDGDLNDLEDGQPILFSSSASEVDESDSEDELPTAEQTIRQEDDSDAESIDSDQDDPLRCACF